MRGNPSPFLVHSGVLDGTQYAKGRLNPVILFADMKLYIYKMNLFHQGIQQTEHVNSNHTTNRIFCCLKYAVRIGQNVAVRSKPASNIAVRSTKGVHSHQCYRKTNFPY